MHEASRRRGMSALAGEWWRDAASGLRLLRRSPRFATVAILTLALAIGSTTVIFSAQLSAVKQQLNGD